MSKIELSIVFGLTGILIGMIVCVFMSYNISKKDLDTVLVNSCTKSNIDTLSISFFGKKIKIQCTNGEVHVFDLF